MSNVDAIRAMRPADKFKDHVSGVSDQQFRTMCKGAPIWHSVDLGDVFIEGARKNSSILAHEIKKASFPDFKDKTVLDIGSFGGFFAFEAERRGAKRVVALEYYSWAADWAKLIDYIKAERAAGRVGNPYFPPAGVVDEIGQPGRVVFDVTKKILGSKVEPFLSRAEDYSPSEKFDIVLYLGVLYHCENPLLSLRKVSDLAGEMAIIETHGVYIPGMEARAAWEFYGDDSVNSDVTTWWAPNDKGLLDMLKAVGFRDVKITSSFEMLTEDQKKHPQQLRIWAHAYK